MTYRIHFLSFLLCTKVCTFVNELSSCNKTNSCSRKQLHSDVLQRSSTKHIRLPLIIGAFYSSLVQLYCSLTFDVSLHEVVCDLSNHKLPFYLLKLIAMLEYSWEIAYKLQGLVAFNLVFLIFCEFRTNVLTFWWN